MGRCALAAALFSTLFAFVACGHDSALDQPANACVKGQTASCACKNGSASYQLCKPDGVYGACECDGAADSSSSTSPDAGSSTASGGTQSNAGTQGNAGGASGTSAGTAGSPVPTPRAGAGAGGAGGSAGANAGRGGSGGSAGSVGGSGGSAGSVAGSGGSAGSAGSAGNGAGTGGIASEPGVPLPGTAFGRCLADNLCDDGSVCATTTQSTNVEGYCAPECVTHDDGTTSACPQPTSGGVSAVCLSFASLCVLTPCGENACPHGMQCIGRNSMGQGQQGSCQYPVR